MIPFHRTGYARDLFSNHIPRAVRALESIAKSMCNETELKRLQGYRDYVESNMERISSDGWVPVCYEEWLSSEESSG